MVGWKRIVMSIGEKIGTTHLAFAQTASAELVAMTLRTRTPACVDTRFVIRRRERDGSGRLGL
jgi:hypothetical protein